MTAHEFNNPRNIFEKLKRDNARLAADHNGDNMYNFIMTANHLYESIKKWDMAVTGTVKRFQTRVEKDENIKHCNSLVTAKEHLIVETDNNKMNLKIGNKLLDSDTFRKGVMELLETFFK